MESLKYENQISKGSNFDEQWEHPENVKVFGENKSFDVYDISPEENKQKTKIPLVVGLGWGEIPESGKKHIKYWVEHGRRVIVPDAPHGISAESIEGYPSIEIEKMSALIETLKSKGIEIKEDGTSSGKVDLMGRSEGAIFSILLAYLYPELVNNLILENPAGLTGKINMGTFAVRWMSLMKQQIMNEYKETGVQPEDYLGEVLGRDFSKSMESVLAISKADVREMLKEIKINGIGISVIATTEDKFFPIEKLAGTVEPEPLSVTGKEKIMPELTAEHVDGFYSMHGSHNSYFFEPEKFAMVIDQGLDALEAKKKKEEETKSI